MNGSTGSDGDADGCYTRGSLRSIFRAEFESALRPPKEVARLAELDGNVKKLLATVKARKKASASGFKPPPRQAELVKDRPPTRDVGVQQEDSWQEPSAEAQNSLREAMEREITDVPPEPTMPEPKPLVRYCVYLEASAAGLREQVNDARSRLLALDNETTRLHRELKKCRVETWTHQRSLAHVQSRVATLIDDFAKTQPEAEREEELELEREERLLTQRLTDALQRSTRWSTLAKRQDTMLQQEREQRKGKDVEKVFARHPAGDVFILPYMLGGDDDDSEDDSPPRHAHGGARAPGGARRRNSASSSDDDDESTRYTGSVPSAPAQRWRGTLEDESLDTSGDASAMPSPSESGGSSRPSPLGAQTGGAVKQELTGASDSSEDDRPETKAPPPPPAPESAPAPKAASNVQVPPLPGLAGGKPPLTSTGNEDADSYTEDEIEESIESSRSI